MPQDPQAMSDAFRHDWQEHYGACQPLGWHLRQSGGLPWVRFHALPGSKRYAEDEAERRTILSRAYALGDRLLGPRTPCWLVEANPDQTEDGVLAWTYSEDGDDPFDWRFYVRAVTWEAGAFETIFTAIAACQASALWMSRRTGAVLAPYDGGFDLFPATPDDVIALRDEHPEWLSSERSGL